METLLKGGAVTPDEMRMALMDWDPLDSPHGSKAIMVSGFQAIDPATGLPEVPEGAGETAQSDSSDSQDSETVQVGRQALSGR